MPLSQSLLGQVYKGLLKRRYKYCKFAQYVWAI